MEANMFELRGLGGLVILALDLWALISIYNSSATSGKKLLWALLVIILPILGFLIWLVAGPRGTSRRI
ncbi:PLD nuclease N-terminal domain-containing protein [Falsirhodobacter xinxiangensis]|uniref:PLD nuclease N-terminal domain-containing protein n=1 Tax=Falsirhodobacter xinxiangensis TaxID=2530049 RepID=UPI001FE9FC99|nr:PLD nuclease N-terminal domain-containing protein [Rhodobacter xinxiangensis]